MPDKTPHPSERFEREFYARPRRTALNVGLSILMIITVLGIVAWLIGGALYAPKQAGRIAAKALDAENVIANYEWFKRQVQDVAAMDQRLTSQRAALDALEASAGPRSSWTFEDKTEHARLTSIIAGLEGQRASMVGEYNARTQMANRDLFRTSDLPATLN